MKLSPAPAWGMAKVTKALPVQWADSPWKTPVSVRRNPPIAQTSFDPSDETPLKNWFVWG